MSETQAEIERHNARTMWDDVLNHLRIACECIDHAQSTLEADLDEQRIAESLQPLAESIAQYRDLAHDKTRVLS